MIFVFTVCPLESDFKNRSRTPASINQGWKQIRVLERIGEVLSYR